MHKLFIWMMVILSVAVTSCTPKIVPKGPWVKKIHSEDLSRLMINYSVLLKKEQHLDLEDSWVSYDDEIKKIYVQFSSQRLLTVEQARLQIVKVVEGLLLRLNNHTLLSYELAKYPFTAADLNVKINYESYFGRYVDELYVGLTWLSCGCVHFYAFDRKDPNLDWDHSRFEPYFKSRELALLREEAELPFTKKEELSNQVDYRGYGRYQGYSINKDIEQRFAEQPKPRKVILETGRDDEEANDNIQTIVPINGPLGESDESDTSFDQVDPSDAIMFLNYDREGIEGQEGYGYPNYPDESNYPNYSHSLENYPLSTPPYYQNQGMPEGYVPPEYRGYPSYPMTNQEPNYAAEILNQNIDAGSPVPDVLNTEIDPGYAVPDPSMY